MFRDDSERTTAQTIAISLLVSVVTLVALSILRLAATLDDRLCGAREGGCCKDCLTTCGRWVMALTLLASVLVSVLLILGAEASATEIRQVFVTWGTGQGMSWFVTWPLMQLVLFSCKWNSQRKAAEAKPMDVSYEELMRWEHSELDEEAARA